MENVSIVKGLQTLNNLNKDSPDIFLAQIRLLFLMSCNFLEKISIIGELHNYTKQKKGRKSKTDSDVIFVNMLASSSNLPEGACTFIDESLVVGADVHMLDRGQYAHFVQSILFFFI